MLPTTYPRETTRYQLYNGVIGLEFRLDDLAKREKHYIYLDLNQDSSALDYLMFDSSS
jgi:hypothetical protein